VIEAQWWPYSDGTSPASRLIQHMRETALLTKLSERTGLVNTICFLESLVNRLAMPSASLSCPAQPNQHRAYSGDSRHTESLIRNLMTMIRVDLVSEGESKRAEGIDDIEFVVLILGMITG